jgi:hypothetical protein
MAEAGAIRAGAAFVELFADQSALNRDLKQALGTVRGFAKGVGAVGAILGGMGAAIVTPLTMAASTFADLGGEMSGMSKRTGISVESLSQLGFAAGQTGVDMEELTHGFRHMQRSLVEAGQGSAEAAGKFQELGLSVSDLAALKPDKQFEAVADAFSRMKNPAEKSAAAMGLFGRGGVALLPLLSKGASGIQAFREEADRLGITMQTSDALAASAFKHEMKALDQQMNALKFNIGAGVAPVLSELIGTMKPIVGNAIAWARENRGLVTSLFKFGLVLVAAGTGLGAFAAGLAAVSFVVGAIISPLGLVVIGVAALGTALYFIADAAGGIDALKDAFAEAATNLKPITDAIKNAINAGDISAAWDVAMGTLKLGWVSMLADLQTAWVSFNGAMEILAVDLAAFLLKTWENIKLGAIVAWLTVTRAGGDAIRSAVRESQGRDADIDAAAAGKKAGIDAGVANEISAAHGAEGQARQDLQNAINRANALRPKGAGGAGGEGAGLGTGSLIGESLGQFGGGSAGQLGFGTGPIKQLVDAAERTADATEKIADEHDRVG